MRQLYKVGPRERDETPWGPAQHVTTRAPGIVSVSTAGHGGYWLCTARTKELLETLPGIDPFLGPGQWYEEDCDWALVVVVWPALFTIEEQRNALRCLASRKRDRHVVDTFLATDRGQSLLRAVAEFEASQHGKWEAGSCSGGREKWVSVHLTQCGTGKTKVMGFTHWPTQQFYTDAELGEAAYKPPVAVEA